MPFILIYLLKVSVSLSVVFLFYQLVLRKLTYYNWNRWYLASYTLLSFFIPFINITPALDQNELTDSGMLDWVPMIQMNSTSDAATESVFTTGNILSLLIIMGMLVMFLRLVVQLVSFHKMMSKATIISHEGMNLYQVNEPIIPFSFGNSIFINRQLHSEQELQEIIHHEFIHVKQKHSIDIIWGEVICLLNWYNPFAWLLRRSIRQNLEFIADNKVLENGIDRKQYQYLLLKVIGNNHFSIAQKFNFSSLKKRIAMMNKIKSARINLLRFLFVLPLLAVILVSFREQIADSLTGKENNLKASTTVPVSDSIPRVKTPNSKGYIINVVGVGGNCTVVVKDKTGTEVKRLLLNDWNEKHDDLYGEIPPPPPSAPSAPVPPGEPTATPVVAPTEPISPREPGGATEPVTPVAPGYEKPAWMSICKEFEITETKAIMQLNDGKVETYDLTNAEQKTKFEKKYGKIISAMPVYPTEGILTGVAAIAAGYNAPPLPPGPLAAGLAPVVMVDDYGYMITGAEDIVVTITNKTTRAELEDYKKKMKEKGVELDFDDIEYNSKGVLISINGSMKSGESKSIFSASDFTKLILAMIKKGDETYFKVSVKDGKEVI